MEGLFSKRELLEGQAPVTLVAHREKLLEKLSDLEAEIHLVNDVLDGNGWVEENERPANPREQELVQTLGHLGLYDASQDNYEVREHPEDDRWIVRGTE